MSKNLIFLLIAKFSSDVGAFISFITFSGYVYIATQSSIMVGIFFTFRIVGILLGSIFAPRFFYFSVSKRMISAVDFVRLLALLPIHFLPLEIVNYYLLFVAFSLGFGQSIFNIGINTKTPLLFAGQNLLNINGWVVSCGSFGVVFGSFLAGILIAIIGYDGVFFVNTLFYIVSSLACLFISDKNTLYNNINKYSFRNDLKFFINKIKLYPILGFMLLIALLDTFASGSHNIGQPILASITDPQNPNKIFGFLIGTWAFGKFFGTRLVKFLLKKYSLNLPLIFSTGVFTMSFCFIMLFWQNIILIMLIFAFLAGIGDGIIEVSLITYAQAFEDQIRSFVLSTFIFVQMIGFSFGLIICSFVFKILPPHFVVTIFHSIPIFTLAIFARKVLIK